MTNRELLEMAAKAIGGEFDHGAECITMDGIEFNQWNPLEDDSDALRLAVAMRIDIGFHGKDGMYAQSQAHLGECQGAGGEFDCGLDDYALTRRSIVEAAAEIGSLKP